MQTTISAARVREARVLERIRRSDVEVWASPQGDLARVLGARRERLG
jgi:hypothetical protein